MLRAKDVVAHNEQVGSTSGFKVYLASANVKNIKQKEAGGGHFDRRLRYHLLLTARRA